MSDATIDLETSSQLRIEDLAPQAVELTDEEIRAVSGGSGDDSPQETPVRR